ncbi:hypothetical protein [Vibrio rumoiensis]|uniref:Uncharacterized protein n=1 Tax=Vibrio rumoiensis 1S-45 TaxID=1188252 RepID=A0A1E5DZC8_9VIBR|nr:hypothetical protein [Vibrio rumoiensis]OEF23214.1 hypothetical protein A1QC_12650 [Vibrio rumoiensis 1S-45]
MLDKVKGIVEKNDLEHELFGNLLTIKYGRIGARVKIKYDYASNSYVCNCGEYGLVFSSLIFFALGFHTMHQTNLSWVWGSGYVAGLMFGGAILNLFIIVLAHMQILDLKVQLREIGVYLKNGS